VYFYIKLLLDLAKKILSVPQIKRERQKCDQFSRNTMCAQVISPGTTKEVVSAVRIIVISEIQRDTLTFERELALRLKKDKR
jgi:hypothetical protein